MATGDKYDPVIIPYCKPTPSQVLILQSCPLLSQSEEADVIPSSSSSEDTSEQPTGIIMVSLPDSSDDYQTPPEEHSQNSGQAPAVFDEMPEKEQKGCKSDVVAVLDRGKRKLLVSLDNKVTECSKHDVFKDIINRVLKMLVAEGKGKDDDDGKGVDFLETVKKKGMTFPRPRWRSAQTWKGL